MIEIKKIEDITYGIIINSTHFFLGINNEFKILNLDDEVVDFPFTFFENQLCKIDDKKLYYRDKNEIYEINCSNADVNRILYSKADINSEIWIVNDNYLFEAQRTANRREYEFSLIEKKSKKKIWSDKSTVRFVSKSNKYLLFTDFLGGIYQRRCIDNGKEIWSLDFSDNRIQGKVLVIDNIIVFPTTNQDLIGIEIETGKEMWRLKNINANFFQIQPNTNYLISLVSNSMGDNWYYVINPINGKIIVDKKFDDFYYGAGGSTACIDDDYYYFISNDYGYPTEMRIERITHLGCINLQTHEIEWIEKIGTTSDLRSGYQKPEVHNGKIYLLDGEKTLHVYEL